MTPYHYAMRASWGWLWGLALAGVAIAPALAESRPHAAFSTADGLPSDEVNAAVEDAHGFVWLATGDGLARFDGRSFRVFDREQGLEDPFLLNLSIDPDGTMWVGAVGGVWRFDPAGGGKFSRVPASTSARRWFVLSFARAPDGTMWIAARDGLYRFSPDSNAFERVALADATPFEGRDVAFDRAGNLWYATTAFVWRRAPDGSMRRVDPDARPGASGATDLHVDRSGRLWMTTSDGVCVVENPATAEPMCRPFGGGALARAFTGGIAEGENGILWVGSRSGVFRIDTRSGTWSAFESDHPSREVDPLLVDDRGGLWLAPRETGIERWSLSGVRTFGPEDGLESSHIRSAGRDRTGALVVMSGDHRLHRWKDGRLGAVQPRLPGILKNTGWGWGQTDFQDRDGRWWVATGEGVLRYPRLARWEDLARTPQDAWLTEKDGLPGRDVFRLYEDAAGDVWISTLDPHPRGNLARWRRSTGAIEVFGEAEGLPPVTAPTAFVEDSSGALWIGFYTGQIVRRRGGHFESLAELPGLEQGMVASMMSDRAGRLWIATSRGLFRCDDPRAEAPSFVRYGRAEGLGSERVRALAEDGSGRLFVGTAAGVDVLEPATRVVWPLTQRDGLPRGLAMCLFFDGADMWYGATRGLARIDPVRVAARRVPPDPVIDAVRVGGVARPVPATGLAELEGLELAADERQLQIDVVAPTVDPAEPVRLQYRIGDAPWSAPSSDRSILLASVAPGRARLEIRAMSFDGTPSKASAIVGFRALAPWWRRPWFLALVAAAIAGAAALAYRARVQHLVALERQQRRIAMDLHDEIGSGLGSIGLLADLAADPSVPDERRLGLADEVGTIASELGGAMGEIVWSLRPGSETVEAFSRHLVERARRIFPGGGATLVTEIPAVHLSETISLAARRHAMLVALEALHNAARHSGAMRVELRLERTVRRWTISVSDDGRGLDAATGDGPGMGLENMRRRAGHIDAELDIVSPPGGGTTVRLTFDPKAQDRRAP